MCRASQSILANSEWKVMRDLVDLALGMLDMKLVRKSSHDKMASYVKRYRNYDLLEYIDPKYLCEFVENLPFSKS